MPKYRAIAEIGSIPSSTPKALLGRTPPRTERLLRGLFYGLGETATARRSLCSSTGSAHSGETVPDTELVVGIPGGLTCYANISEKRAKLPYETDDVA